jgi:uncharacterized protein (TIGR02118 family)
MIKRFVVLRRKAGLSKDEFSRYWAEHHGPLIARLPGLKRYVQYHVRSDRLDDLDPEIDGIAELWFEDEAAQKAAYATEEYARVVEDEANLFDPGSTSVHPVLTVTMVEIVGGEARPSTDERSPP